MSTRRGVDSPLNTYHADPDIHQLYSLLHTALRLDEAHPHHNKVKLQTLEHRLLLDGKPRWGFFISNPASDRHPDSGRPLGSPSSQQ